MSSNLITAPMTAGSSLEGLGMSGRGLTQGMVIGRYVILGRVGTGGAGSVYSAYDTQLDRRVALKVLHGERGDTRDPTLGKGWSRLVREARILGKLSHPNVVTIFDLGTEAGVTFIAMELVEGVDLGDWLEARTQPPLRDTVPLFVQAARGLAAAHAEGIVHGDFKPANVLIGDDERVRVSDFGVARIAGSEAATGPSPASGDAATTSGPYATTERGQVVGTPYYMAPEQYDGVPADVRSDVYSFCVALYEAVYDARPFGGESVHALAFQKAQGTPAPPQGARAVPAWLRALIARGLDPEPSKRFDGARDLLSALDRTSSSPARWAVAAAGFVALAGAAGVGLASNEDRCAGADRHLSQVWDPPRRQALEAAFSGTDVRYAAETWDRVEVAVDRYTDAWVAAHTEACRATQFGEQSEDLLDRRMTCLEHRRTALSALLGVLSKPDPDVIRKAADSVAQLEPLAACGDSERLLAQVAPPPDPETARAVDGVRAEVDRARALGAVGKYREGTEVAQQALEAANAIGYGPVQVEAALQLGTHLAQLGEIDRARALLSEAHFAAEREKYEGLAAEAALWLVFVVGDLARENEAALTWSRHAEASLVRAGNDPLDRAQLHVNVGIIQLNAGNYDEARAELERALDIRVAELGAEAADVSVVLNGLGNVASREGRHADAQAHYERALELKRHHVGDNHPSIGITMSNLGITLKSQGRYDQAQQAYEDALELWRRSLGPRHPQLGIALNNLGSLQAARGRPREAADRFGEACELWEGALGDEHPDTAMCWMNLGASLMEIGDTAAAEPLQRRSLKVRQKVLGPHHPDVAASLVALGNTQIEQGRSAEARASYEEAITIWTAAIGPQYPELAFALTGIAKADLADGHAARAVAMLERARTLERPGQVEPKQAATTLFRLARAVAATGRQADRSVHLATRARDLLAEVGEPALERLSEVDAWLAARSR